MTTATEIKLGRQQKAQKLAERLAEANIEVVPYKSNRWHKAVRNTEVVMDPPTSGEFRSWD